MSDQTYDHNLEEKVQQLTASVADVSAKVENQAVELNMLQSSKYGSGNVI